MDQYKLKREMEKRIQERRRKRLELTVKLDGIAEEPDPTEGMEVRGIKYEGQVPQQIAKQIRDRRQGMPSLLHPQMHKLEKLILLRKNAWLAGPAGSGKTTACILAAEKLGLNAMFQPIGQDTMSHDIFGFRNAQGEVVRTPFRECWENGGVCIIDEIDDASVAAAASLNTATAGKACGFPDGTIPKHEDCIIIATANTYGTGGTIEYVGKNRLNAATLDRFIFLDWQYDERMERVMSFHETYAMHVQRIRSAAATLGIKHVISPRATIDGSDCLAMGFTLEDVERMIIFKGLDQGIIDKIMHQSKQVKDTI